jgi:hypothetical protein
MTVPPMPELPETCYACGRKIIERTPPKELGILVATPKKIGKYTIRRQAWDENWNEITEDIFFHENCYFNGFVAAIRYGYSLHLMEQDGTITTESLRADHGVDHE